VGAAVQLDLWLSAQNPFLPRIPVLSKCGNIGEGGRLLYDMCVVVRTTGSPAAISATLRQELHEIHPNLPVLKIDTIEEQLADVLVLERSVTAVAELFGVLAMALACLGLYGVISYRVVQRTTEIGVRMALGATRSHILQAVLKESLSWMVAGVVIGVPLSLAIARLLSSMLFDISAADPVTIAEASLLMIGVGALAAFLPALQASRVDPMVALRCE
jgi:putative ABC transport system permease protein